jgi:hypothetical protein
LFIAILTKRDKVEGKDLWKGPDWVQNEIGFAIGKEKPFSLFVEEGIDPNQGIGHWETDNVVFNRRNLRKISSKTEKIIEALKNQVAERVETRTTEEAIIEEPEASTFDENIITVGRFLIEGLYGRLDVSLWKIYTFLLLVSILSAYFVYDYIYGYKIVGLWGDVFCLALLIVSAMFVSSAEVTQLMQKMQELLQRERKARIGF